MFPELRWGLVGTALLWAAFCLYMGDGLHRPGLKHVWQQCVQKRFRCTWAQYLLLLSLAATDDDCPTNGQLKLELGCDCFSLFFSVLQCRLPHLAQQYLKKLVSTTFVHLRLVSLMAECHHLCLICLLRRVLLLLLFLGVLL